jgi:glycosyltransferase involved in cell wall biosynthesis
MSAPVMTDTGARREERPTPGAPLRAVMIAFEFPPLASGGVHRAIKLAKFLPRFGVELDIVTVHPEDARRWSPAAIDETLGRDLPDGVRVHRIASGFPEWYWRATSSRAGHFVAKHLHWGDHTSFFWRGPLGRWLDAHVAARRRDALFATVPPFGVASLTRAAAHRHRLPWIVDWRDPWTMWQSTPFATYGHYRFTHAAERRCLREANASICTSHVTRADWLAEFRGIDPSRLHVVYNGHDPDDAAAVVPERPPPGRRRIVYVGSFYYDPSQREAMLAPAWRRPLKRAMLYRRRREDWLYRSPYFFLRGLRRFADARPELAANLDVVFAGKVPSWLPAMLRETRTETFVALRGPVPHRESLALQAGADALLLTSAKIEGGRDYSIAGKTYEYLGMERPVLGIVTDGAMRDLLEWSGLGVIADPDDEDAVVHAIESVASGASRPAPDARQRAFVASLHREESARRVGELLRAATAEGYRGRRDR